MNDMIIEEKLMSSNSISAAKVILEKAITAIFLVNNILDIVLSINLNKKLIRNLIHFGEIQTKYESFSN